MFLGTYTPARPWWISLQATCLMLGCFTYVQVKRGGLYQYIYNTMGGFSSVVALQLHKLETRVRFPPPTQNRRDWWLSSVTLLLGDKDIWMVLVT